MSPTTLLYLCSALLLLKLGHGFVAGGDKDLQFELEASEQCYLGDLKLKSKENIIECFPKQNANNFTRDGSSCLVSVDSTSRIDQNDIALLQCLHGVWTETSLGEKKNSEKRWAFAIALGIGAVIGIGIGVAVACSYWCPTRGASGSPKRPPAFSHPCRPADLLNEYYVEPRHDKVTVTWTKPSATDPDDGKVPRVTLTSDSESGSEFEGSVGGIKHTVIYKATDDDGLSDICYFRFTVKKQFCESAPWPLNGQRMCDRNAELGSVCNYSCHSGYELLGNSQVACEDSSSPSWTSIPTCSKVICPTPPRLENGDVICSNEFHEFGTTCSVTCNTGFQLTGIGIVQCQADGTWSSFESTRCTDQTPPVISCPTPQIFYADRATNSTSVQWELPTAVDNVDQNATINQTGGQNFGSVFESGSSFVKYKAIDSQGNESPECEIEIRVEVTSCQHPSDVIQDDNMKYSCTTNTYMYGTECTLSCKFNILLTGTDLITCERTDLTNLAVGTWSWGDGVEPLCNQTDCPALDPPVNGALQYSYVVSTLIATMLCNDQFDIPVVSSGFTGQFICQNSGTWNPNIEVPDCVVPRIPLAINLPVEIFYYSGDCNDPATHEQIRSNVQQILDDSVNIYIQNACQNVTNCTTSNLQIICGETTTRRKRRAAVQRRLLDAAQSQMTVRQKRQSPPLIVEFHIEAQLVLSLGVIESIILIDDLLNATVKPLLQELFQNGTFNIADFTVLTDSMQVEEYGDIDCSSGHVLKGTRCYPCPAGYFKNSITYACQVCPVGQYSDVPGSTSCTDCPVGTTTLETGSKNQSQCLEICPAGQISAEGTLPCTPCLVGYYQSDTGQKNCDQCTTGITKFTGSDSSDACEAFQILVDDTTEAVNAGSISENMSDLTLMFWTKPYANLTTNASIRLTSGGSDVMVVYLSTVIGIQIPNIGTGYHLNVGSLTSLKWTHVGVTWNTTHGELLVYVNGAIQSSMIIVAAYPLISFGSVLIESTGNTGVYIADLHVEDAVVQASEIESVTESCWNDRPDDVFSLNDIRFTPLQGVTIQAPTSCDPVDECAGNPCNNNTCITGEGTYRCICSGGWSGDNCTTPPDYCVNHGCVNEATCVNGNSGYTCSCVAGYSGDLCDFAPVNGGWSEWSDWTACTATCDGGTQVRTRSCDSPEPSPYGNNCTGDAVETQACGQGTCPVCGALSRGFKMTTNCAFDNISSLETCNVSCRTGYVLPPSLSTFTFTCGLSTNYTWKPMPNAPNCVDPRKPNRTILIGAAEYQTVIPAEDLSTAEQLIKDNLSNTTCAASSNCTTDVVIANPRKKRSAVSTITVTLTIEMTDTGALDIQSYLETSSVSPSFQELIDAINTLEDSASFINTSSSNIFDITVNGVAYTSDPSTLTFKGNVTCPPGETAVDGVCAACPEGAYYTNGYCSFCEKGTYTSTTGETTCTSCPAGFTTTTIGSYAASQCTVIVNVTTTTEATVTLGQERRGNSEDTGGLAMYIGLAISGVALVVSLTVCGLLFHRKFSKTKVGSSTTSVRESKSYSREESSLTVRDIEYNIKTSFHNPSYNTEACQNDGDFELCSDRVARSVFQHKAVFAGDATAEEIDYICPVITPPPPYQEDETRYANID